MHDSAEDRALLAQVASGDEDAFARLIDRYHARLWRYCWSLLGGDNEWVQEALQDVYLAVWRSAASFRGSASVATWMYSIARNIARTMQRHRSRRAEGHLVWVDDEDDGASPLDAALSSASHESEIIDRLTLDAAIDTLSGKQREVIELAFYHGFTLDEVAQILAIPSGTVKSRLNSALRALRRFTREMEEPHVNS